MTLGQMDVEDKGLRVPALKLTPRLLCDLETEDCIRSDFASGGRQLREDDPL